MVQSSSQHLGARHIQDMASAKSIEKHWGYADRALPCTNDPGSCEYLDLVYHAHDVSLVYSGILWIVLLSIFFLWAVFRQMSRPNSSAMSPGDVPKGGVTKVVRTFGAGLRSWLLPDAVRAVFGRTTRYQVFILASLATYLLIFSFVGLAWKTWMTPVKGVPGLMQKRSSLGPWVDRVGILAYALTPLSILLSSRESILSLATGVPYQSFQFLHRWLGYIIFIQGMIHTIGWTVIETIHYQPQPKIGLAWVVQPYIVWGIVAMILLTLLVVLSTPWGIRLTGYETFRKMHYVFAMVYIGACWAHWEKLSCFLLPSLCFWFLDRGFRLLRTGYLHYHCLPEGGMGFRPCDAEITRFPDADHGDVYRLDFENDQDPWAVGQHYYLCFTESSIWQSHPFTPLNDPIIAKGRVKHSYIVRAKGGETKKVANLSAKKLSTANTGKQTLGVVLTGAYGEKTMEDVQPDTNILCIAGGTGISYVLPVLLRLARSPISQDRKIELIWAVRHVRDTEWIEEELERLRSARKALNLKIRIFATRDPPGSNHSINEKFNRDSKMVVKEAGQGSSSAWSAGSDSESITGCECGTDVRVSRIGNGMMDTDRHPNLPELTKNFLDKTVQGPTTVFASGPGGMISDLRTIVANCNSMSRVWNGEERYDVRLVCDDRLEW